MIPDGITKDEISDLISIKTSNDEPSTGRHRAFAESFGLEPTQYVGKKLLFDGIWNTLKQPDRQPELLQWFAFRVYRHLVHGSLGSMVDSALGCSHDQAELERYPMESEQKAEQVLAFYPEAFGCVALRPGIRADP